MKKTHVRKRRTGTRKVIVLELMLLIATGITYYERAAISGAELFVYWDQLLAAEIALCIAVLVLPFGVSRLKRWSYRHSRIGKIDKMSGEQFEEYVAEKFRAQGYRVERVGGSYDYGADLILKKHFKKMVVQCKRYSKVVGIAAVQQIIGAKDFYGADGAMVVSNSYFTKAAQNLANSSSVVLIDREKLTKGD